VRREHSRAASKVYWKEEKSEQQLVQRQAVTMARKKAKSTAVQLGELPAVVTEHLLVAKKEKKSVVWSGWKSEMLVAVSMVVPMALALVESLENDLVGMSVSQLAEKSAVSKADSMVDWWALKWKFVTPDHKLAAESVEKTVEKSVVD
jgi:hypothetical protein